MTKRMTAEEVAAWINCKASIWQDVNLIDAADRVRENLVPQWQAEAVEGPCWVRGVDAVCSVYHWHDDEQNGDGGWSIEYIVTRDDGSSEMRWEPLNGRQVCPIGARPQ